MTEDQLIEIVKELTEIKTSMVNMNTSFIEFKQGIGQRQEKTDTHINNHCTEISVLNERISSVTKVIWGIVWGVAGACSLAIMTALFKLILK